MLDFKILSVNFNHIRLVYVSEMYSYRNFRFGKASILGKGVWGSPNSGHEKESIRRVHYVPHLADNILLRHIFRGAIIRYLSLVMHVYLGFR